MGIFVMRACVPNWGLALRCVALYTWVKVPDSAVALLVHKLEHYGMHLWSAFYKQACDGHLWVMETRVVVIAFDESTNSTRTSKNSEPPDGGTELPV